MTSTRPLWIEKYYHLLLCIVCLSMVHMTDPIIAEQRPHRYSDAKKFYSKTIPGMVTAGKIIK